MDLLPQNVLHFDLIAQIAPLIVHEQAEMESLLLEWQMGL